MDKAEPLRGRISYDSRQCPSIPNLPNKKLWFTNDLSVFHHVHCLQPLQGIYSPHGRASPQFLVRCDPSHFLFTASVNSKFTSHPALRSLVPHSVMDQVCHKVGHSSHWTVLPQGLSLSLSPSVPISHPTPLRLRGANQVSPLYFNFCVWRGRMHPFWLCQRRFFL